MTEPVLDVTWMDDGLCLGLDPDVFFPSEGSTAQDVAKAKAVCALCKVREDCFEYAMANREKHGVWGGTSPRDRGSIWRRERLARRAKAS